jgi:hypothetical protein
MMRRNTDGVCEGLTLRRLRHLVGDFEDQRLHVPPAITEGHAVLNVRCLTLDAATDAAICLRAGNLRRLGGDTCPTGNDPQTLGYRRAIEERRPVDRNPLYRPRIFALINNRH